LGELKKNIVFIGDCNNDSPFSEFVPLAIFLKKKGYDPFFVLEKEHKKTIFKKIDKQNLKVYIGRNIESTNKNQSISKSSNSKNKKFFQNISLKKLLPEFFKNPIRNFLNILHTIYVINLNIRNLKSIFKREKPKLVVLYGDRAGNLELAAIKVARLFNIKTVFLQISIVTKNFIYHSSRKNKKKFSNKNILNYFVQKKYPNHIRYFNGQGILFYNWAFVLIYRIFNILPKNPWNNGDSFAFKTFFISNLSHQIEKNNGGTYKNYAITGQISIDSLYKSFLNKDIIKKKIQSEIFDKNAKKKLIIIALPQFYEHNLMSKKLSMIEINYLLNELNKLDEFNILVSLHPKMEYENYAFIEEAYSQIRISKDRLSSFLGSGDFFISPFESTIHWAILCKVVPIFLDYYNYEFDMSKFQTCQVLENKNLFYKDLVSVFENEAEIRKNFSKDHEKLPAFDGKSGERIFNEIEMIVNEK
tara:strand:+ start:2071 stop:3489 length:1419 start_codon:yes stop_codon:yes gene_type:complete